MKKIFYYLLTFLFLYIFKKTFDEVFITDSFFLTIILELLSTFIFSYILLFFTDKSKIVEDKLKLNIFFALFFAVTCFVLYFMKARFNFHIINFLLIITLILTIIFRDYFIHYKRSKKDFIYYISLISFFLFYKYFLNFINRNNDLDNRLFFSLIPILSNIIYSLVYSFFVKGNIEFDGFSHYLFEDFKVGRKKEFDIYLDENINNKKLFFTLFDKKNQICIKPYVPVLINNEKITEKKILEEGTTVELENNYFTVSYDKGSYLKRFFFLLTFLIMTIPFCAEIFDYDNSKFFSDYSDYPYIKLFTVTNNDATFFKNRNYFFIGELDQFVESKKVDVLSNYKITIYFILDATGNMPQRYKEFIPNLDYFFKTIIDSNKEITVNVTTFADEKEDINYYNNIKNSKEFGFLINNMRVVNGKDYPENPFDAIVNTKVENDDSLKIFLLFTDAPPHIKGDRGKDGVLDFTDQDISSVKEFIESNNILMLVASYERFSEYKDLYKGMSYRFFEIENIDNYGNILVSLANMLSNTILFKYKSNLSFRNLKDNIVIFTGEDANIKKKIFLRKNLKKRSFFRSLFQEF